MTGRIETDQPQARRRSHARSRRPNALAWLIAPAALLFLVVFVLPFCTMALLSVLTGNPVQRPNVTFTARNYDRILEDSLYAEALLSTLKIGLTTTLAALLIGYPLAHWLARIRSRTGYGVLLILVIAPMLTGIVVRTFAWMAILSDTGVINAILIGLGLIRTPIKLMYNEFGTTVALVHIYVPFMVLTLAGVIGRIDVRLEEAARSLGAGALRTFPGGDAAAKPPRHRGGVAARLRAGDLRLRYALSGGWRRGADAPDVDLPADRRDLQFGLRGGARDDAAGRLHPDRRGVQPRAGTARPAGGVRLSPAITVGRAAYFTLNGAILFFLIAPIAVIAIFAVNPTPFIQFPPVGISGRWFVKFWNSEAFINSLVLSLEVAVVVVVLSMAIGGAAAIGLSRGRLPGAGALTSLFLTPLMLPAILTGLALFQLLLTFGIGRPVWALVLGHTVVAVPYVIRTTLAVLADFDGRIEEAAAVLGAAPARVFAEVTLPLIRPGVFAGGVFAFITSFDQFPDLALPGAARGRDAAGRDGSTT